MNNNTEINSEILSNQTQINDTIMRGSSSDSTVINSAVSGHGEIPSGTVLCQKYKVIEEMPLVSGEASLFLCEFEEEKYVAKLYHRDVAIKDDVISALKRIDSPYVAKLFDTGTFKGFPFEILPYYKIGSLQGKTYSFEELKSNIIPSLNEGLRVLHTNGIIHKDLKPSNIMLCDNEKDIVIIDFGISSVKGGANTVIVTKTGIYILRQNNPLITSQKKQKRNVLNSLLVMMISWLFIPIFRSVIPAGQVICFSIILTVQ